MNRINEKVITKHRSNNDGNVTCEDPEAIRKISNEESWNSNYRGIMEEKETQAEVDSTLEIFNANKMVLGHTVVDSIKYLYNKKVIGIDLHHQENSDKGFMYALFFENGEFYVINNSGNKSLLK